MNELKPRQLDIMQSLAKMLGEKGPVKITTSLLANECGITEAAIYRHFPSKSKLMYKAASGAIEYINIFEVSNINSTLKNLKEKNFWVYGFDGNGKKNFTDIEWKGNNILLFGSEGSGMHKHTSKYADFLVKIEINEKIQSLNVSNSAAIVFHHLSYLKKKS